MNSNTSEESRTTYEMDPMSIPSNLTQPENHLVNASSLEPTMRRPIPSNMLQTGESVSNPILMPTAPLSSPKSVTPSEKPLLNLKSQVTANEILESRPPEPKILKVRKEDVEALCQMIREFKDQFVGIY